MSWEIVNGLYWFYCCCFLYVFQSHFPNTPSNQQFCLCSASNWCTLIVVISKWLKWQVASKLYLNHQQLYPNRKYTRIKYKWWARNIRSAGLLVGKCIFDWIVRIQCYLSQNMLKFDYSRSILALYSIWDLDGITKWTNEEYYLSWPFEMRPTDWVLRNEHKKWNGTFHGSRLKVNVKFIYINK